MRRAPSLAQGARHNDNVIVIIKISFNSTTSNVGHAHDTDAHDLCCTRRPLAWCFVRSRCCVALFAESLLPNVARRHTYTFNYCYFKVGELCEAAQKPLPDGDRETILLNDVRGLMTGSRL